MEGIVNRSGRLLHPQARGAHGGQVIGSSDLHQLHLAIAALNQVYGAVGLSLSLPKPGEW